MFTDLQAHPVWAAPMPSIHPPAQRLRVKSPGLVKVSPRAALKITQACIVSSSLHSPCAVSDQPFSMWGGASPGGSASHLGTKGSL